MPPLLACRWRDRERGEGGDASEAPIQTHARYYAALVTWSLSPSSGQEDMQLSLHRRPGEAHLSAFALKSHR